MTYEAIGLKTGKTYASGTKEDCFRELNKKYPYFIEDSNHKNGIQIIDKVYPETILIRRRTNNVNFAQK